MGALDSPDYEIVLVLGHALCKCYAFIWSCFPKQEYNISKVHLWLLVITEQIVKPSLAIEFYIQ